MPTCQIPVPMLCTHCPTDTHIHTHPEVSAYAVATLKFILRHPHTHLEVVQEVEAFLIWNLQTRTRCCMINVCYHSRGSPVVCERCIQNSCYKDRELLVKGAYKIMSQGQRGRHTAVPWVRPGSVCWHWIFIIIYYFNTLSCTDTLNLRFEVGVWTQREPLSWGSGV